MDTAIFRELLRVEQGYFGLDGNSQKSPLVSGHTLEFLHPRPSPESVKFLLGPWSRATTLRCFPDQPSLAIQNNPYVAYRRKLAEAIRQGHAAPQPRFQLCMLILKF